jgi:CheY-like chemotaxis protein
MPDAVLLDISIPKMEGLERRLRALRGHSLRMIAFIAPSRPIIDRHQLIADGSDDVLTKPLSLAEVNKALPRK